MKAKSGAGGLPRGARLAMAASEIRVVHIINVQNSHYVAETRSGRRARHLSAESDASRWSVSSVVVDAEFTERQQHTFLVRLINGEDARADRRHLGKIQAAPGYC